MVSRSSPEEVSEFFDLLKAEIEFGSCKEYYLDEPTGKRLPLWKGINGLFLFGEYNKGTALLPVNILTVYSATEKELEERKRHVDPYKVGSFKGLLYNPNQCQDAFPGLELRFNACILVPQEEQRNFLGELSHLEKQIRGLYEHFSTLRRLDKSSRIEQGVPDLPTTFRINHVWYKREQDELFKVWWDKKIPFGTGDLSVEVPKMVDRLNAEYNQVLAA